MLAFHGVDAILHAGDLSNRSVIRTLEGIAPVYAVHGNVFDDELFLLLPKRRLVRIGDFRIGLVHGDGATGTTLGRALSAFASPLAEDGPIPDSERVAHVVVFGHSHQPYLGWHDGVLTFNPGSATDRRRAPRASCGILYLDDEKGPLAEGAIRAEHIWL